jgi:hypothetical protein
MAVVTLPQSAPRQYRRTRLALLLLVFLGLISLVGVSGIKLDCANEYLTGGGGILTAGGKALTTGRQQYWLVIGGERVPLPVWTQAIMAKSGLLSAECR